MQAVPPVEEVRVGSLAVGGDHPPLFIAGPCVIESRSHCLAMGERLASLAERHGISLIFKSSYDKANRTSIDSFRGPGLDEGLAVLAEVREKTGLAITSDIHETGQVAAAAEVLDLLQIPAFLCRQTDLVTEAARTGTPLNIKKGQFLAPEDVSHVLGKVRAAGGDALVTERGASFGYNDLVTDFRAFPLLRGLGAPVVFDATHSMQRPGGRGDTTGGTPEHCAPLARAAAACGVDGFFFEVHDDPPKALSDAATQVTPAFFDEIVPVLLDLSARVREGRARG